MSMWLPLVDLFDRFTWHLTCSGYGISAQALTAVVRAYDGRGPETVLTNNMLDFLGLASPDELIG
jgi:N-acetylglucosamine kinase-like BadF-type ATPase